jgi:hypothetical protein
LWSNVAVWNTRGIVRLPVGDTDKTGGRAGGAVVSFPQPLTLKVAAAKRKAALESHVWSIEPRQKQK